MNRKTIIILGGIVLGTLLLGSILLLRETAGVAENPPKQAVEEDTPFVVTLEAGEANLLTAVNSSPPIPSPTLMLSDITPTPSITPPIDLFAPRPTWTRFPTPTIKPTVTVSPTRTFQPQPIGVAGSPAGEILYALRKPVSREPGRNLPPFTYIYYWQPVSAQGLAKGSPSRVFLPAEVVSKLRLDTDPYGLYYSPSGKYLIVTVPLETGELPYVIDLRTYRLIGTPFTEYGDGFFYGWHPDGEHFLFGVYMVAIWLVDAKTLEATELVTLQGTQFFLGAAISPNGKQVAYATGNYDFGDRLWIASIPESDARTPVPGGGFIQLYPGSWSPDSMLLSYSGNCKELTAGEEMPRRSLCIFDRRTGEVTNLQPMANGTTAWSPDGRYIAVSGWDPEVEQCSGDLSLEDLDCYYQGQAIYLIDLQMGENRKLVSGMLPTWSPDGSMLAFLAYENEANDVWTIRIADNELSQITSDGAPKAFSLQWFTEK